MRAIIEESWLKQPVWYKLYKTALIRDIPFPVGKYHEDVFWSYQAVARAQKVSVSDNVGYYYAQRSGSIMGEGYSLKRLDAVEAKTLRLEFIQKNFPELEKMAKLNLLFTCLYMGQMSLLHMDKAQQAEAFEKLYSVMRLYPLTSKDKSSLPLKQQVWLLLSEISFPVACKLRNSLKICI